MSPLGSHGGCQSNVCAYAVSDGFPEIPEAMFIQFALDGAQKVIGQEGNKHMPLNQFANTMVKRPQS